MPPIRNTSQSRLSLSTGHEGPYCRLHALLYLWKNAVKENSLVRLRSRNYLCLAKCADHGWLKGKIRLRQREDEKYYAVKTLRFVNEEEVVKISERKKAQQSKAHHPSS